MKHKKVIVLSGILVLAALLTYVVATHFGSGQCGENAAWRRAGHTMTISGTGPMTEYYYMDDYLEYIDQIGRVDHVKTVVIEDGITTIGMRSFDCFQNLSSVVIPDSVTSIGVSAFHCCLNLTNVTIPDSVTSIGDAAFWYCDKLTGFRVAAENQNFCNDEKGVLYDKAMTTLLQCPAGLEGTFEVPASVTSIRYMAFVDCHNLTNVTIPESVTSIGGCAFVDCPSLSEITFEGDAPVFDEDCFLDVEATVYYPTDDPSWTPEVMKNYGGKLTWVAY